MKTFSAALISHLAGEVTTLCTCWKLTRCDGTVQGFTDHDRPLDIDGIAYQAASGFTPTAIASSSALSVDNLEVDGMLDAGAISEVDLLAGRYDYAAIEIFEVNHADPGSGRLPLRHGWLGEVTTVDGRFVAEIRGLAQPLAQRLGDLYGPTCRAQLGDARCKVAMAARTVAGTLTAITSRTVLHDSARADPPGRFSYGTIRFTGGANAGVVMEIKQFGNHSFTLALPLPYAAQPGDAYVASEGCDKTFATCAKRFGNAVNFRGEPHVPGIDRMLETASTRTEW